MEMPDDLAYEMFGPILCPCYRLILLYHPKALDWLECAPVTFHPTTMAEEYNRMCFSPLASASECIWQVNWISMVAAMHGDEQTAAVCYSAIRYGGAVAAMDDQLAEIVCDCIHRAQNNGIDLGQPVTPDGTLYDWSSRPEFNWNACNDFLGNSDFDVGTCK